jgi:Domain of unknown function (DUF4922)
MMTNMKQVSADPRIASELAGTTEHAIRILVRADAAAGLFTYDHSRAAFYQVRSPDGRMHFTLQEVENRANRPKEPPRTACPIDLAEIQDRGRQHWILCELSGRKVTLLANPYGFWPNHVTVASADHEPQSWRSVDATETRKKMERVVRDVYQLASELPTFVVIYNGQEAGASLPDHLHIQLAEKPPGFGLLAIQEIAMQHQSRPFTPIGFDGGYPICAGRFIGPEEWVIANTVAFLEKWDQILRDAATANLIAVAENGQVAIYVVLRNALFRRAQGIRGVLGSMEVAGMLILSSDHEFQMVREGRFSFARVWELLAAVRPPEAQLIF